MTIVLDKDAWHTLHLASLAAGGLVRGAGNPWNGDCGCLLSLAAFADGRPEDEWATPPDGTSPVTAAVWKAFGAVPEGPRYEVDRVWIANDDAIMPYERVPWNEACRRMEIIPSE